MAGHILPSNSATFAGCLSQNPYYLELDVAYSLTPFPLTFLRNHGSHFEKHKTAFEEGGGADDAILDDESERVSADEKGRGVDGGSSRAGSFREDRKEKV